MNAPNEKPKYEFGRHETFAPREGWLAKGLAMAAGGEGYAPTLETADALGLGSRMAKSLAYWLAATGLAARDGATGPLRATEFGAAATELDPHFEYPATLWFVHVALSSRPGSAWRWFFQDFRPGGFDRETCVEAFARHLRDHAANQTTPQTMQREVACLLSTYAALPPAEGNDPEDYTSSPLRGLGLVAKQSDTGRFEKAVPRDRIPPEAFLAAAATACREAGSFSLPLADMLSRKPAPGRTFNLDGDRIADAAQEAADLYSGKGVSLDLLGASRTITLPDAGAVHWYRAHFDRIAS